MQATIKMDGKSAVIELTQEQVYSIYEQTQCKKYELKGGTYWVTGNGVVENAASTPRCRTFGNEYATDELAEQASTEDKPSNRLRALRNESMCNKLYEPDWENSSGDIAVIYYDHEVKKYDWYKVSSQTVGAIHMPMRIARQICKMLNSGEFEL